MALLVSRCSLRKCIQGDLEAGMARVEVGSYEVPVEDVQHMEVAWTDGGEAVFHDICWKALLDSVKMENPFSLSALEKDLVIEAKKTAEYFDSREKVKAEGRRIANMLRSSKYAIAFTGQLHLRIRSRLLVHFRRFPTFHKMMALWSISEDFVHF